MKKLFGFGILVAGLLASAFGANRIGPVSQYGQLQAGKNSSGKGQIYGSCKGVSAGNEVQVQGMSLFWSISSDVGAPFWKDTYVNGLVEKQNIQVIRAPMGVDEDWSSGHYFSSGKTSYYQGLMNNVVQAAIANDIYVIIDYHSHHAHENVENAKTFFRTMAEKYGKYDNVIFEVYNEPLEGVSWSTIKTYAEAVISEIRKYSDNLVVVGNRSWDQYPNDAISSPINDKNVAYTFHFYAGSHSTNGEGANAVRAMNAGLSVFVTEWGTVDASGNGGFSKNNSATWLSWMNQHKLSGANWSVSNKPESASYFSGSAWNYSESGKWVNENVFAGLPKTYTACDGSTSPASSSSAASSSSVVLPAGYTDYIDDFEDGDSLAYTGGVWYAYNDNENGAASSFGNAKNKDGYKVVLPGSSSENSTKYVAGLTGIKLNQGSYEYDPFVALGVKLYSDESAYDLSSCNTISYKFKGAGHNFKVEDTAVKDYGYHQISKNGNASWTNVSISWDDLMQESWAEYVTLSKKRINKFTWEIKGSQPFLNYLYIDDVRCNGVAIKKVSATPASSSSSATPAPSFSTTSKTVQSVVAGNAIEPIVYKFENVTNIVPSGLPKGVSGSLDQNAKTFTVSGTVDSSLSTKDYAYVIDFTGVDGSKKTANGTIKVTRAPVVTTLTLTSNNAVQSITAGESIKPIVYKYENITGVQYSLPEGLTGTMNESAKTFTISGSISASSSTRDYDYSVKVTGLDNDVTLGGTIKVTRAPVVTTLTLTSDNSVQSITAGESIKPIVYKYENITGVQYSLPEGLTRTMNESAKTITISGSISASSPTRDYDYSVKVTGLDNDVTLGGTIKVTAIPPSSSSIASSSSVQSSSSVAPSSSSVVVSSSSATISSSSVTVSSSSVAPSSSSIALSSSSIASSSSVQSSSSIAPSSSSVVVSSSSATISSSSVTVSSSSVAPSSSSIALSSSSIASSSSAKSSSSIAPYVITGSLEQSVVRGGTIEPVVITGVNTYSRKSWNINFLPFPENVTDGSQVDNTITISGSLQSWGKEGDYQERLKVNGEEFYFTLHVLPKSSSSSSAKSSSSVASSSSVQSSSSVAPSSSSVVVSSSSATISSSSVTVSSSSVTPSSSSIALSSSSIASSSSVQSSSSVAPSSSSVIPQQSSSSVAPSSSSIALSSSSIASSSSVQSSSSVAPSSSSVVVSSSSAAISSSSEQPVVSSSSEQPVVSSSSEQPATSSSSLSEISSSGVEQPQESSSSDMEGPLAIAGTLPTLNFSLARNALTVSANNASVKIQIFDLMGNALESHMEQVSGSYVMSLEHLNKGSYLVRVTSGSLVKTARIAIK